MKLTSLCHHFARLRHLPGCCFPPLPLACAWQAAAAIVMARKAKENAEGMEERTDDELLEEVLQEKAEGKFDLPEYKDPEKHEGAARAFLEYTKPLDEFVKDEPFSNFVSPFFFPFVTASPYT